MARVKFADDVVGAIFKEVKQLAKDQKYFFYINIL